MAIPIPYGIAIILLTVSVALMATRILAATTASYPMSPLATLDTGAASRTSSTVALDASQFTDPCPLNSFGQLNCTTGQWEGNVGRNTFRGPGYANVDFSSGKYWGIPWFTHEGAKLQLRGDYFNLFNRTNLNPAGISTDSAIGGSNPNFTRATSAFNPRTIQVALRVEF